MSDPDPTPTLPQSLYDQGYINAMVHFYRGELGRIMMWRQRLDTTTTWAITSTTTIFTVAFTVRSVPHIIFFFNIAIVWIMLWIEARRYRFYDAFRARVRMLEAHFLVPMVMQNANLLQGDWKKLVCEDLLLPSFKISSFEAVGRRLKRNYIFIFMIILAAWIAKIFLHAQDVLGGAAHRVFRRLLRRAGRGRVPEIARRRDHARHVRERHRHHHLHLAQDHRRNLRVRHAPHAVADLRRLRVEG